MGIKELLVLFWNSALYQPLVNALIFLYELLFHNFGLAIIFLTVALRAVMIPLTLPSLKAAAKMKELQPELNKLKKQYAGDKKALAAAQLELYKKYGINPAAGCLPQIVQLVVLIALYQAFIRVLNANGEMVTRLNEVLYAPLKLAEGAVINTRFLYLDLAKPDVFRLSGLSFPLPGVFLVLAAAVQFLSAKMMMPVADKQAAIAEKTAEKSDDLATAMQTQSVYIFPLMTIFIGFTFPSGLVLYWFVFSAFQMGQQYLIRKR
ncbi:MAG: YidC/Oxa1 family membrane protein insertase [Candidatus Shapirobacteria bacterium]